MKHATSADTLRQYAMPTPATEPGPTAWARVAQLFLQFALRRGVERGSLLRVARLSESVLEDPDGRVPLEALYDLLEAIQQATGDPEFGLDLPLGLEIEALDALGFLFMTSATFGSAMERMLRYQRLWNEGERLELTVEGELACLSYEPYGPPRPAHVAMAQATLSDIVANTPRFVPGLTFVRACFRHAAPREPARYERVLGVPVAFAQPRVQAQLERRMLELPIPDANSQLCAFFERYASQKLERLSPVPSSIVERLRAVIRRQLPEGELKISALAEQLHMSARTLQRRLQDQGTSLQAELDEVRRQQALYFLQGGTAIAELSWLLGYAEPASFHHAFKRWTGMSPEGWRASHRLAPA